MLGGCAIPRREPANLYTLKQEILAYVNSGAYQREIARVAENAKAWIETRASRRVDGERLCVVLDVDETLLSNLSHMRGNDFGYLPASWDRWVQEGVAPAIEPVRDVFRGARARDVDVVILTGRRERDRAGLEKNLRDIGCGDYAAVICRPDEARGPSANFKRAARERLTGDGWTIIANVGDQVSDLAGGFAERTFKLPNPFYLTQ
jgi:predicted secreted acid phosphatase